MISPNDLLVDRVLTAALNELAPTPQDLDDPARLSVLDKIIGALLREKDTALRALLLDSAAAHLRIGKRLARERLANAINEYVKQENNTPATTDDRSPVDKFRDIIASATDSYDYLLRAKAPQPDLLDSINRLRICDDLLAVLIPMPDHELRNIYLDETAKWLDIKPKDVRARLRKAQIALNPPAAGEVGGEEKDGGFHRALVASLGRYLMTRDLHPDAVNGWRDGRGNPIGVKTRELVNHFHYTHASYFESLPRDRIDITLAGMTGEARDKRRAEIWKPITGKPSSPEGRKALSDWLLATTHRDDPVDYAVMLHWIWQVKRLNTGRSVAWDLMPILVGKQGDGKSTAIEILCGPLAELMIPINAEALTDSRSSEILGDQAVGFWGEMSGGSKAEVQALKATLTAKRKSYRELGGHHHNNVVRRMAFIGDSNLPVKDVIADPTGMRRFYEIEVNGKTDHSKLNNLQAELIWLAVSEDDEAPFSGVVADEVRQRQKQLVTQDSFDHFLAWCEGRDWGAIVLTDEGRPWSDGQIPATTIPKYHDERGYTLTEVSILYKFYAKQTGTITRGDHWVSRRMRETGWTDGKRPAAKPGEKRPRYYFRPEQPVDTEQTTELNTRAGKMTGDPTPSEDLFSNAVTREAITREPGADEEEGYYRQEPDDDALPM